MTSTSTEPHPVARAMLYSKGKASQRPAFTPAQRSKIGPISHTTANLAQPLSLSHLWQGGIGPGLFDCNALPATSLEIA
jgi:hypothetical protein